MKNRNTKLEKVLKYASENVPFYQGKDYKNIDDFPIIRKEIIKENYADFISDLLDNKNEIVHILEDDFVIDKYVIEEKIGTDIFVEWTTGTSGVPFKCFKTKQERKNISLCMWKKRMMIDKSITPLSFLPIIHTGTEPFPFDIRDYSYENLINIYKYIEDKNINCIHISPTLLKRHLAQEHFKYISIPKCLKYIESTGRFLDQETKETVERVFDVKIFDMYGTIETWGIAETCKYDHMHVNTDNIYLELIDEHGKPITDYNKIGIVVITALNQYMMPFIRYQTNDYAMLIDEKCECGQPITLKLCKWRESHYLNIDNEKIVGEDFVRKILRKVEYERVFQNLSFIMVRALSDCDFEIYINKFTDSKSFENLFIKYMTEEIKKSVRISFNYITEKEHSEINPKGYIFVRKY